MHYAIINQLLAATMSDNGYQEARHQNRGRLSQPTDKLEEWDMEEKNSAGQGQMRKPGACMYEAVLFFYK